MSEHLIDEYSDVGEGGRGDGNGSFNLFDGLSDVEAGAAPVATRPSRARFASTWDRDAACSSSFNRLAQGLPAGKQRAKLVQKGRRLLQRINKCRHGAAERGALVAAAWNSTRIRQGDCVVPHRILDAPRKRRAGAGHSRAWTAEGVLRLAWQQVGARRSVSTRRPLDALGLVAWAHQHQQEASLRIAHLQLRTRCVQQSWALVARSWDCTPLNMRFGALGELLAPIARYWRSQPSSLRRAGAMEKLLARAKPAAGIVELLAQTVRLSSWTDGETKCEDMAFPPCFVRTASGSAELRALEVATPSLNRSAIVSMTRQVPLVVLSYMSDLASSNVRLLAAQMEWARKHNEGATASGVGFILLLAGHCTAHVLHTIIENAFATHLLKSRLHATCFTLSHAGTQTAFLRALEQLVRKDFATGYRPQEKPPSHPHGWQRHLAAAERDTSRRREDAGAFFEFFNGDWAWPIMHHYCQGCCENRAAAEHRALALLHSVLVAPLARVSPSTNRWASFAPSLWLVVLGHTCHRVLPRGLQKALSAEIVTNEKRVNAAPEEAAATIEEDFQVRLGELYFFSHFFSLLPALRSTSTRRPRQRWNGTPRQRS